MTGSKLFLYQYNKFMIRLHFSEYTKTKQLPVDIIMKQPIIFSDRLFKVDEI
jgi:hypothetical protein